MTEPEVYGLLYGLPGYHASGNHDGTGFFCAAVRSQRALIERERVAGRWPPETRVALDTLIGEREPCDCGSF